jgi:hypothetical protein
MAGKKDPSIYDDRSGIGSSEELDEYGVWVKSEPQELPSAKPEIKTASGFDSEADDDINFSSVNLSNLDDLPDIEDLSENLDLSDFSGLDDQLGIAPVQSMGFDEITEPLPAAKKTVSPAPGGDLSTQLLMKIAEELSSIKKELTTLKGELAGGKPQAVHQESHETHGNEGGGFFDEEDDEKIALTGDELNNILNTADFTEENGFDAGEHEDLDLLDISPESTVPDDSNALLSGMPDIIDTAVLPEISDHFGEAVNFNTAEPDGGGSETPLEEPEDDFAKSVEDFDVSLGLLEDFDGDAGAQNETAEDSITADDGLDALREEGVAPVTKIEEDISYLEEDPMAAVQEEDIEQIADRSSFEKDEFDLSGTVIEDPDVSVHITENLVEEPSIENISIDLDMEENSGIAVNDDETSLSLPDVETEEMIEIPMLDEMAVTPDDFVVAAEGSEEAFPAEIEPEQAPAARQPVEESLPQSGELPSNLRQELKTVLSYMDHLLESLPEEKIEEFARSEYFDTYKKLFEELGLA